MEIRFRSIVVHLVLFIAGILCGMLIYSYKWFPTPQFVQLKRYFKPPSPPSYDHVDKIITPYYAGVPLFSDRTYYDSIGDPRLESSYLVQVPRHLKVPIELEIYNKVGIFRILSSSNDNSIFADWQLTNIKTNIEGVSCTHTDVIYKEFGPGKILLQSGGPIASSPILVKDLTRTLPKFPFRVINVKY